MPSPGASLVLPSGSTAVPFVARRFLGGGHRQTLAASLLLKPDILTGTVQHRVPLEDGDTLVLHDDTPPGWPTTEFNVGRAGGQVGARTALLIHGLGGSHTSPYMTRITRKLVQRGVRTFRMDLRGCGAGETLARLPYHSGRSEDAAAALRHISELCPGSPVVLMGFSLGANITLKLLGESPATIPPNLERALAVCPPVDLARCVRQLQSGWCRMYDRFFVRLLLRRLDARLRLTPDLPLPDGWPRLNSAKRAGDSIGAKPWRAPQTLEEFDDRFTAPLSGYRSALHYYQSCSSLQFLPTIRIPTLVITANDDPIIPAAQFDGVSWSASTRHISAAGGGHMGFIGDRSSDPDRYWLDWRAVAWALSSDGG